VPVGGNESFPVFQDPRAHINPVRRIGDFMTEALCTNLRASGPEARRRAGRDAGAARPS
jgi:ABC-type dipeptide/oligopeptide/nickel transport system ATPase component